MYIVLDMAYRDIITDTKTGADLVTGLNSPEATQTTAVTPM